MNYTFVDEYNQEQEICIPDEYIDIHRRNLGITEDEAIDLWLYDNDYIDNAEADALTEKASQSRIDHGVICKERKSPRREANLIKQGLIQFFYCGLLGQIEGNSYVDDYIDAAIDYAEIVNKERTIMFAVDGETYELTLAKKRTKKE